MSAIRFFVTEDGEKIPWEVWLQDHPEYEADREAFVRHAKLVLIPPLLPEPEH
jgi:hypothetical protein